MVVQAYVAPGGGLLTLKVHVSEEAQPATMVGGSVVVVVGTVVVLVLLVVELVGPGIVAAVVEVGAIVPVGPVDAMSVFLAANSSPAFR